MLYQLWESNVIPYLHIDDVELGLDYGDDSWGDYVERMQEVFNLLALRDSNVGSETTVYVYGMFYTRYWPSWKIFVCAFDGVTGALKWKDTGTWGFSLFLTGLVSGYFTDLDNRTWVRHDWGHVYRCVDFTQETSTNNFAAAPGLPDFGHYDVRIENEDWLDYDGVAFEGTDGVTSMHALLPSENVALGFARKYSGRLCKFEYSTRTLVSTMKILPGSKKMVVIDSTTIYDFHDGGAVTVINYRTMTTRGVFYMGKAMLGSLYGRWYGLCLDPVYRRLLICAPSPNEEDGASTTRVKAYAPIEIPIGLTKPIPSLIPREGRTVPVFARVYGHGGHGIPGVRVDAEITSGGTNTLQPTSAVSDSYGHVFFSWTCNDAGSDIDEIALTATYDAYDPSFTPGTAPPTTIDAPTSVDNPLFFKPGWWGWSSYSSDAPSTKWSSFVEGYTEIPNPLVGIVQEYSWTDIETSMLSFDYSKIEADAAYLDALGLKLMIYIKLKSPDNDTTWVPYDITDEDLDAPDNFYPISLQIETEGRHGIVYLGYTQGYGFYPTIWDPELMNRYKAMLTSLVTHFQADDRVVGIFPVDDDYISSSDLYAAAIGASSSLFKEARRELLTFVEGLTNIPVWTVMTGQAGDHTWCRDNGIAYTSDEWTLASYSDSWYVGYYSRQEYETVPTGIKILSTDFAQLDCTDEAVTPLEIVWDGPDMSSEDPECYKPAVRFNAAPWFVFWPLVEPQWSLSDYGIEVTCTENVLPLVSKYYGA